MPAGFNRASHADSPSERSVVGGERGHCKGDVIELGERGGLLAGFSRAPPLTARLSAVVAGWARHRRPHYELGA